MLKYLGIFLLTFQLSSTAFAKKKDPVIAVVGNKKITLSYFKKQYRVTEMAYNRPSPEQFLNDLIRYEMGVQEAEKNKLRRDPIIRERVRQEMYKLLLDQKVTPKFNNIKITERDLKREYQKSPELRTSHILFQVKPNATKKQQLIAKKRALEILNEIKTSKKSFEEFVKLYSDDSLSKAAGGDTGYQTRLTSGPEFYDAVRGLKVGEVAKTVPKSQFGYHIIKLTGKRTFKQANKRHLQALAIQRQKEKYMDSYFKSLGKRYKVSIKNKSAIKKLK